MSTKQITVATEALQATTAVEEAPIFVDGFADPTLRDLTPEEKVEIEHLPMD